MDRLIALVGLHWKIDLRAVLGARERLVGLLFLAPLALLGTGLASAAVFLGVRALERASPGSLLPVLSAAATLLGLTWMLSPLLVGVAMSETHDMSRLLHFPVAYPTLVASSLVANLTEPMVLVRFPVLVALAAALSPRPPSFPLVLVGVLVSFGFALAAAQVAGLLLLGLSRNRRLQDWALFLGVALGFLLSLLPLLAVSGRLGPLGRFVLSRDPFVLSPFAWGARAAVYAGRGEAMPFALFLAGGGAALAGAMVLSALVLRRVYLGELALGSAPAASAGTRTPMLLPGAIGALLEKDLRIVWRDPRLKATLFTGLLGPLVVLLVLWPRRAGPVPAPALLLLAYLTGLGGFGGNAFGLERRGLLLLFSFPVERWKVLLAKNGAALLLRIPSVLLLALATLLLDALELLAPVVVIALVTLVTAAAADNFLAILFPLPVPGPGRNPYGSVSGSRGLGAAVFATAMVAGALLLAAPFVFLAWLPLLLERRWLWLPSLPLALAGALAVYVMLLMAAARLLGKREPDVLARVLAEE